MKVDPIEHIKNQAEDELQTKNTLRTETKNKIKKEVHGEIKKENKKATVLGVYEHAEARRAELETLLNIDTKTKGWIESKIILFTQIKDISFKIGIKTPNSTKNKTANKRKWLEVAVTYSSDYTSLYTVFLIDLKTNKPISTPQKMKSLLEIHQEIVRLTNAT